MPRWFGFADRVEVLEGEGTHITLRSVQVPASRARGLVMRAFGRRELATTLARSLDALELQLSR